MSSNTPQAPSGAPPSWRSPAAPSGLPPSQRKKVVQPPPGKPKKSKPKAPPTAPPSGRSKPQSSGRNEKSNRNKGSNRNESSRKKRRESSDSDTSSSESSDSMQRKNPNGQRYSVNKKRLDVKKRHKAKREDIPTKYNDYLGRRLSTVLRGEDEDLPDLHDFLYDDDIDDEYVPDNFFARIIYNFRRKAHERKFLPRALLCALAVTLLWCSSAAACRLLISAIIPTPSYTEIETEILSLQERVDLEKVSYTNCVVEETETCQGNFARTSADEAARILAVQESNQGIIDSEELNLQSCLADFEAAVEEVNDIIANQLDTFLEDFARLDNDIPDNLDCNLLEDSLGSELDALAAVNAAAETGEDSEAVVQNYEDQLAAREEYDRRYMENITRVYGENADALQENLFGSENLNVSLAQQQGELRACLSETRDFISDDGFRFVCDENQSVAFHASQFIGTLGQQYDELNASMQEYIEQVEDLEATLEALQSVEGALGALGIGLPPFDLDADPLALAMDVGLEQLQINEELIEDFIEEREQELLDALNQSDIDLDELDAEMKRRQEEFLRELNENYTLPGTDPAVAAQAADAKAQAQGLGSGVAGDLESANGEAPETDEPVNFTLILEQTEVNFLNGLEDRSVDFFAYEPDVFLSLESNLNRFIELILLFDVLWRVMQSLLLIKKYWGISAVATPPADVTSQKGRLFKEKKNIFQKVGGILTNPLMQMAYNLFVIAGLSLLFYLAYQPLFNEFVTGCINNNHIDIRNGTATGTMIFRNLDTMTVGIAASEGDQLITTEVDRLNVERQLSCSDLLQDSVNVRQSHIRAHDDLSQNYNSNAEAYNLFNGCINWAQVDADNTIATAFVFDPIFNRDVCNREILPIDRGNNALHECDNVAACDILNICDGPNLLSLALSNHNAACEVEYALHSYFLVGLFASLMFICLNLARFYFLRGIVEVGWPTICLDVYSYLVSCTERGTIIPPEEVEEGEPFQDVIKEALDKALRAFTMKGYMDLFFAVSINLPWIIFISVFGANIEFEAVN